MKRFFDYYPSFYETGISATPNRLQARYEAIIEWNQAWFPGSTVLDLASHDGRWSFAAFKAGARQVTGVEARDYYIEAALRHAVEYGVSEECRFVQGDANLALHAGPTIVPKYDVILCCGFLYHARHPLALLEDCVQRCNQLLIIDTVVADLGVSACLLREEKTSQSGSEAVSGPASPVSKALVQIPSAAWIEKVFDHFGLKLEEYPWKRDREDWTDVEEYKLGTRRTYRVLLPGSQVK